MKANLLPTWLVLEAKREQKMLTFWQWRKAAVPSASERSLRWVLEHSMCAIVHVCLCVSQSLAKSNVFNVCLSHQFCVKGAEESYKQRCWKCWA